MTKQDIREQLLKIFRETQGNIIDAAQADDPSVAGLQLYDEPLIGFGSAEDALFEVYKKPGVVGPWLLAPREWLPSANTVISLFMPFTARVKDSNEKMTEFASLEWAYARIEGQQFLVRCVLALADWLRESGAEVLVPLTDPRFFTVVGGRKNGDPQSDLYPGAAPVTFSSTWSERHAAFVCGLGTFGMSRGIITEKGMAGRFGSLILSTPLEPDVRPYTDTYEYCIRCGICADRCPVNAFPERCGLKDHTLCAPHVDRSKQVLAPRYGCGLCQVNTPCRDGIPSR